MKLQRFGQPSFFSQSCITNQTLTVHALGGCAWGNIHAWSDESRFRQSCYCGNHVHYFVDLHFDTVSLISLSVAC